MSEKEKIVKESLESYEEVFGKDDHYQPDVDDQDFDKAAYVKKLQTEVASEEASLKTREALRAQLAQEAKDKIDQFIKDDEYQPEDEEDFDKDAYVARLKARIAEEIKK